MIIRQLIFIAAIVGVTLRGSYALIKKAEKLIQKENKSNKFYKEYIV